MTEDKRFEYRLTRWPDGYWEPFYRVPGSGEPWTGLASGPFPAGEAVSGWWRWEAHRSCKQHAKEYEKHLAREAKRRARGTFHIELGKLP